MSIHQKTKSLAARGSELADTFIQLEVLNGHKLQASTVPSFEEKLHTLGFAPLRPSGIEIFQMNIGKLCRHRGYSAGHLPPFITTRIVTSDPDAAG